MEPQDDQDNSYAYSSYGAKARIYAPSSDPQEVTILYPGEENTPLVYVVGTGAAVSKVDTASEGDTVVMQRIDVGATKLASEVSNINAVNSILVGGPCANAAAATVMGNPADCTAGFEPGVGRVVMYDVGTGNVAMLVAGYSALDTRNAAQVVANYKTYSGQLTGSEVAVTKVNNQLTVAQPSAPAMADDSGAMADTTGTDTTTQ